MKRWFLPVIALLFCTALAFAQAGPRGQEQPPGQLPEPLVIEGTLGFVNGQIAVESRGTTYYVRGLDRLFGFVDGLKEGAPVKLEGYAADISIAPEYKFFLAEKLTFNGKEYGDLLPGRHMAQGFPGRAWGPGFPQGLPPPGGMARERHHMRRPSPPRQYYFERRRDRN